MIDKAQITEDYVRRNLGREARIMSRLRHPHIASLYEAIESGHLVCLVTELAPGGDLCSHVKSQLDGRLHESAARPFLRQIISALSYMHSQGIIHRDLKMENVMLDETKTQVKIVDFGLSNFYGPGVTLQTHCGSPEYAAPELFIPGRPYGPEVDVWSLGVIMYGALTGCLPFLSPRTDGGNAQERRHRLYRKIQQGLGQQHWKALANVTGDCRDILLCLLTANPEKRISLERVQFHPYITSGVCSPIPESVQLGLDHPDAPKVFDKLSELLKVPVAVLETEVERDDHCDVAAMFYLLLSSWRKSNSVKYPDCKVDKNAVVTSESSIGEIPESAPFIPSSETGPVSEKSPSPEASQDDDVKISVEEVREKEEDKNSEVLGGAGEADSLQVADVDPVKVDSLPPPVDSGDGIVIDEMRFKSQQRRLKEEGRSASRSGTSRRLSFRHFCFKGQTSDASLTSHLLMEKRIDIRRRQKRDDEEDEEDKRRPRIIGDSCFCMLNYANQRNVLLANPRWKCSAWQKQKKGPASWFWLYTYVVKTLQPAFPPMGRERLLSFIWKFNGERNASGTKKATLKSYKLRNGRRPFVNRIGRRRRCKKRRKRKRSRRCTKKEQLECNDP